MDLDGMEVLHGVFVPGLMVTGILVSMIMLAADGIKRLIPARGDKARALRMEMKVRGRVSDLASVGLGVDPVPPRIDRVPRSRVSAAGFALVSLSIAGLLIVATISAYTTPGSTLYKRGWTLSIGFGAAALPAIFGLLWLASALFGDEPPEWLRKAARHWPIGTLPDLTRRWKEAT
ncbi:MAG: hypothetical protein ACRDJI_07785 [Actinomycetota bacterium]